MSIPDAIKAVETISSDLVALPSSEEYNKLAASYFTELERELKPACFMTPSSASQVAEIVKAIKPFAKAKGTISVGAGELMGNVYDTVAAAGLGVMGGLSYFAYARGFICDDVVGYEVVLADGQIVNANADTNRDLPEKPKALEPFADVQPQIEQMKSLRVANLKALTGEAFAGAVANRKKVLRTFALQQGSITYSILKVVNTMVKVLTVISGEIGTNILKRDAKRVLPEGSFFSPLAAEFEQHVQRVPDTTDRFEYAKNVVAQSVRTSPPAWFWCGKGTALIRFLDTFGFRTIWDGIFWGIFNFDKLKAAHALRTS
ncbi:hypothetical protein O1611_g3103 [Lasiodiplodia mahajangana]|uniref:Uncharacterized protein n=1 Tax=Lasiodiplodia mahajangana TaxID=1108764 RepID=A0ACC2JTE0_9PEZI|nr:hypothetical protein O1611_g3103 [Lasiodiplodia mahajangana]